MKLEKITIPQNTPLKAHFHLPGLFEFFDFYKLFIPIFQNNRHWFYDWCEIGSIYGAPADCLWGGGRNGFGKNNIEKEVLNLCKKYNISARLTFSNSLLKKEHLNDKKCNSLCELFNSKSNGIIIHSDLLLNYIKSNFPDFYFVSSTTKVLTDFEDLIKELNRTDFSFIVPDFRLNKDFNNLFSLSSESKNKIEFLINECCWTNCTQRNKCYENVSKLALGLETTNHQCNAPDHKDGYKFSKAMKNPAFISLADIQDIYLPQGFSNYKIEGRSLGSALLLEFILYYMTKPEYHINLREDLYLDNTLDLF